MRNTRTSRRAALAILSFFSLALSLNGVRSGAVKASSQTLYQDIGVASVMGINNFIFAPADTSALELGSRVGISTTDAAVVPKLQCPIGTCTAGGYKFGDNWEFGKCPATGPWKKHTGVDLRAAARTVVKAAEAGTVKYEYSAGKNWARAILIEHVNGNNQYITQYMHVEPNAQIKAGFKVKRGDPIATVAAISQPHLHFGVWAGKYEPATVDRGALPSCFPPVTVCSADGRTDPCFPKLWVNPMVLFGESAGSPRAVVSTSLRISQGTGSYVVGTKLDGTFSITNRGTADLFMKQILIGGRLGGACPNNKCPDFLPIHRDKTLAPGDTFNYSGSFTPTRSGTYRFTVVYEKADGKWEWPVNSENSTVNELSITVKDAAMTLTGTDPAFILASPSKQTVYLTGTRLSNILYCRLRLPSRKVINIYIPLGQVFSGTGDRIKINTTFHTRGTYHITAFTLLGHSNELAFQVR